MVIPATELRTLPATGASVPAEPAVAVTSYRELPTSNGVAYTATLRIAGKIAGTLENEGRGGCVMFRPHSVEAWSAWVAFVAATPVALPSVPSISMFERGELVAELLITEFEARRTLDRLTRKGKVVFIGAGKSFTGAGASAYQSSASFPRQAVVAHIASTHPGSRVWSPDGQWVEAA